MLGKGVAAMVGRDAISIDTVTRIAQAQRLTAQQARDRAISDALLADWARSRLGDPWGRAAERTALVRSLLSVLVEETRRAGPPADSEVETATLRRWWEIDRPPLRRTTHAVVRVKGGEREHEARVVAERIAAAVHGVSTAALFKERVAAVPRGDFEIKVEDLAPVAADGRTVDPDHPPPPGSQTGRYSAAFVAAAFAIPSVGAVSPVVRTEFGYHVILCGEILAEHRLPLEERRRLLATEIIDRRATVLRGEWLLAARASLPVELERAALDLTEKVRPAP